MIVAGLLLVLAVLGFQAGRVGFVKTGPEMKAHAMAFNLQTAIENYYAEYGHYPVPEGTGNVDVFYSSQDARHWGPLIIALCGGIDPAHPNRPVPVALRTVPNPRGIMFFSPNIADLDVSTGVGIPKLPFPDQNGRPQYFNLAMDGNDDGVLGDKDEAAGKLPDFEKGQPGGAVIKQNVALWADLNQHWHRSWNLWIRTY